MHIFMGFGLGMVLVFIFAVIFGGFFMWIAAKVAGVKKSTFGRAIVAAVGASFVALFVSFVFHFLPIFGNLLGFIIGLILTIFVIKVIFDTSTGKAILVWIFNIIATGLAVLVATIIAAGSFIL